MEAKELVRLLQEGRVDQQQVGDYVLLVGRQEGRQQRLPFWHRLKELRKLADGADRNSDQLALLELWLNLTKGWKPAKKTARAAYREIARLIDEHRSCGANGLWHLFEPLLALALFEIANGMEADKALGLKRKRRGGRSDSTPWRTETRAFLIALDIRDLVRSGSSRFEAYGTVADRYEVSEETAKAAFRDYESGHRFIAWPDDLPQGMRDFFAAAILAEEKAARRG
jgi:hypothetical protein